MKNKRITITGGKGFLGKHLIKALQDKAYTNISIADLPEYNLIKSFTPVPFHEDDLWNGYPEETNAPQNESRSGRRKKALTMCSQQDT